MTNQEAATKMFEATRESYSTAFDAVSQAQNRAIRLGRLWLDEVEATQKESRRVADEVFARSRQAQDAWLSLTQESFRNVSTFWRWPGFPGLDELTNRLDDLDRKVDTSATIKVSR